ncbi:MAG: polysaccharide biosynthesis protein [Streptococcaceae bacterium]|nr:polysaccharide biosynthesis protein [Streptococcaceae bacterium]
MQKQDEATIDFRSLLRLIRKRIGIIIVLTLITTLSGSIYTFLIASPKYTASTLLVAKLSSSDNSAALAGQVTGNIQMTNTINQVVVSPAILDKVSSNLGLNQNLSKNVTATNTVNSQVINVTATYNDPYTAQKIANETATVFSDNAKKILNVTNVSILSKAKANTTPVNVKPLLYIGISAIMGLLLGLGVSLLLEAFNNKVMTEKDLELTGLTVLGATAFAREKDFEVTSKLRDDNTQHVSNRYEKISRSKKRVEKGLKHGQE